MADIRVKDIMSNLVVTMEPQDTIHLAAERLAQNGISGAPVLERGRVVGIVSESDLILTAIPMSGRAQYRGYRQGKSVADVMTMNVIRTAPETSIWRAASLMEVHGVKRLPVVDEDDYLLGIVSRADLVRAMARNDRELRADVLDAINVLGEESMTDLEIDVVDGVATIEGLADRKTTRDLAIKLAARTPGIVEVIDRLAFRSDDTKIRLPGLPVPDQRHNWRSDESVGSV